MDLSRIKSTIDVATLASKTVCLIGAGASIGLAEDLTRSGVRQFIAVDPDTVGPENMSRQGHDPAKVGMTKVDALAERLLQINPEMSIETYPIDATQLPEEEAVALFAEVDLFVAATDSFRAQAWVNRMSLRTNTPAVFIGLYAGGAGGEVVWTNPQSLPCCFRCLCSGRYAAHEKADAAGKSLDPSSDGADIMSIRVPDAIAGQIILGLLTAGADNRFGRLIGQLGDRQFIQISLSPDFQVNGRDLVREKLGVPSDNDCYFTWSAMAMSDPDGGHEPCCDCEELRGHAFIKFGDRHIRSTTGTLPPMRLTVDAPVPESSVSSDDEVLEEVEL